MSASYKTTTFLEIIFLLLGAVASGYGKQQGQPLLLGFGIALMGFGVLIGGADTIRRREISFFNRQGRFFSHRYTGVAAVSWGVMLLFAGIGLIAVGIGIALGFTEEFKALVLKPGSWMIVGGTALFFTSFAMTVQRPPSGTERSVLQAILAAPKYAIGTLVVLISITLVGIGFWGLENPQELERETESLKTSISQWLKDN